MELELNRAHVDHYRLLLDTDLSQEETQEMIVPDAYPDIRTIVETGGQLFLTDRSVQEGTFAAGGTINGWLLYYPEGEDRLCRMEVQLPFSVKADVQGLSTEGRSVVRPVLCKLDARTLNPRKVLVRADVCVGAQLFEPQVLSLCSDVTCDAAVDVQRLTGAYTAYLTTQIREKAFSVYEEVRLPAGLEGPEYILCSSAHAWCTETRLVGRKLLLKGEACVRLRYLAQGKLLSERIPISFSQVMELDTAGELADSRIALCVAGLECAQAGAGGQMLSLTLELQSQAVVCDRVQFDLLQDAYSTDAQLTVDTEHCLLTELLDRTEKPLSMRELLETEVQPQSIVDANVRVCHVTCVPQGETTQIQAQLQVEAMYLDAREQPQSICRTIVATMQPEIPDGAHCHIICTCPGEVFAAAAAGGIEVRFNLMFDCALTRQQPAIVVSRAQLNEYSPDKGTQPRPSAVLRMPLPGERLWDIAKAYRTTGEQICQANALEEASLPNGRMLLIPSGC